MFNGLRCVSGKSAGRRQLDAVVFLADVFAAFLAVSEQLPVSADDSFFSFSFSLFFYPQLPKSSLLQTGA